MDDRVPTPTDLFLSPDLSEAQARAYLESLGFRDPAAADDHLQRMADDLVVREALGRLAPDLLPALIESPDPDAAVVGVSHYVAARAGRAMFVDYLREDPRALYVLTYVMGASPGLGEMLISHPESFHWLVSQVERSAPDRQDHEEELVSAFAAVDDPVEALTMLRRWKRRETLRIGTRDLLRRETAQTAAAQLSDVAAVAVDFALAIVMQRRLEAEGRDKAPGTFAVIGTGRLGGREMTYDSNINLLYVYEVAQGAAAEAGSADAFFVRVGCDLTAALRDEANEGHLYRVGLPPWPQAGGWLKACSLDEYAEHYAACADAGECLALTRACPVAGDAELGQRFIARSHTFVYGGPAETAPSFAGTLVARDVDDIEVIAQGLRLAHGAQHAPLRQAAGTLETLEAMARAGLIAEEVRRELEQAYALLRSAEHRRQLGLPRERDDLQQQVGASRERVREIWRALVDSR